MSAIDTLTHAHVANFFGLPVYWVFEEGELIDLTDKMSDDGKKINQYFLSIGGGSGEHPALIIDNDAVLFQFLSNVEEIEKPDVTNCEQHHFDYEMYLLSQRIQDKYFDKRNGYKHIHEEICYWNIDKNQWPLETFIRMHEQMKEYSKDDSLENKILDAIALFIIHEMPLEHCIEDPDLIEFAQMYKSHKWSKIVDIAQMYEKFVGFTGVLNCQKSGKVIRDNQVVWGYSLNDWLKDNIK